jgi:N-acyl-D-aspartate/D-glutamate deacylase
MAELSGKPIHGNNLGYFKSSADGYRRTVRAAEEAYALGLRYYPMLNLNPKAPFFAFDSTFMFDQYPTWRSVLVLPMDERRVRLGDPELRPKLAAELEDPSNGYPMPWDEIVVASVVADENQQFVGRSVEAIAAERGVAPIDAMLDIAETDRLETMFGLRRTSEREDRAVIDELIDHPLVIFGSSDGGAHLQTFCGADYTTRLLTDLVPEAISLEHAVARLTSVPAGAMGLWDRGLLRPGFAGDVLLIDRDRLAVRPVTIARDFPADTSRLLFDATGYVAVIVNGEVVLRDGQPTGSRPGVILRGREKAAV